MTPFDEAARTLAVAAEQNGKAMMRNAVMRWMLANRGELPQSAVDSLMAQMSRELETCEQSPPVSPPA